jgi:MFS family permease
MNGSAHARGATARLGEDQADPRADRWAMLAVIALAEFLGMSVWFSASASSEALRSVWGLSAGQLGWLTTAVQLGFVAGTASAALLNLPDVLPVRAYFAVSAAAAAALNGLIVVAPGYETAIVLRFATGMALAGVYPPAMKMAATWFRSGRGLAIGVIVGALTVGKATPYLVRAVEGSGSTVVILTASAAALLAATLVALVYRDGPHPFARRPFEWALVAAVLRHRATRQAIGGYAGHMLELYAVWAWVPAFLAASALEAGGSPPAAVWVDIAAFAAIAAGGAGCVLGGAWADRIGRARWTIISMAGSGTCCLAAGFAFGTNWWIVVAFVCAWGFLVVADSAQFSALVTELAPQHAVGTALTLQTSLGFALTMLTIQGVPHAVALFGGWRWAFSFLALGPALGIAAIAPLARASRPHS